MYNKRGTPCFDHLAISPFTAGHVTPAAGIGFWTLPLLAAGAWSLSPPPVVRAPEALEPGVPWIRS